MPEFLYQGNKDVFLSGVRSSRMAKKVSFKVPKVKLPNIPKPPKMPLPKKTSFKFPKLK